MGSNFRMRILHLLLPLLLLLLLHVAAEEEDYGGDAQDAYADSQESDERRRQEELKKIEETHSKKFLDILSYIQSKELEMEGAVRKGQKVFKDFLAHISGLIKDKKYMDFSMPKKAASVPNKKVPDAGGLDKKKE